VSDAVGSAPDLVLVNATGATHPVGNVEVMADSVQKVLGIEDGQFEKQCRTVLSRYSVESAANGVLRAVREVSDAD
jgi:hypothetical protein